MISLYLLCVICYLLSLIKDKNKTKKAIQVSLKMFNNILPTLLLMILTMTIALYLISPAIIAEVFQASGSFWGLFLASTVGSIAAIPGFIAFPLAGILLKEGAGYSIIAMLTTTLMMVGVLTFPLEKKYFGTRVALFRNVASYGIAILVSIAIGVLI